MKTTKIVAAKKPAATKTAKSKATDKMPQRLADKFADGKKATGVPKVSASRAVARKPSARGR